MKSYMQDNPFKLGDLVRKKRSTKYNLERIGVITEIDGDIVKVYWGHGYGSFITSFKSLELVKGENKQ